MSAIRKFLLTSARLLVTAGLLWALAARLDLARAGAILTQISPPLLAAGLAVLVVIGLVNAVRWHVILAAETPSPGPVTLAKIIFVGLFFNQVLPTAIGGDAVRALRCRRLGIDTAAAVRSIVLDRAAGYAVFVLLFAAVLPSLLDILPEPRQRVVVAAMFGAAAGGLFGLLFFARLPQRLLRLPVLRQLSALSQASRRLVASRRCVAVLGLSAVAVALNILVFKLLGDGLGSRLPLSSWVVIVSPVTLMQLFPIALAGWGVREVGIVVALSGYGVPPEAALAISVLFGLCQFAVGLPGGLIWLSDWDIAAPAWPIGSQPSGSAGA